MRKKEASSAAPRDVRDGVGGTESYDMCDTHKHMRDDLCNVPNYVSNEEVYVEPHAHEPMCGVSCNAPNYASNEEVHGESDVASDIAAPTIKRDDAQIILSSTDADAGTRLDVFVSTRLEVSRSAAVRLIEDGRVSGNASKNHRVEAGEMFVVTLPPPMPSELAPLALALDVRFEDDDVIVINKPRGLVIHPAAGHRDDTLVNALLHHCGASLSGIGGELRPGIVHRLDKDTAGLMVAAKNDAAHTSLAAQLKNRTASRVYDAVICGGLRDDSGTVDAPIGRDPKNRKRMGVTTDGREAVTHWTVIARYDGYTHIRCKLKTGRTHQIRVHMAHIGHPLLGDTVYGGSDKLRVGGQCLFASELAFDHPRTGERVIIKAELPDYFDKALTTLRNKV